MNKLKTKLIHLLGGLTDKDIIDSARPMKVAVTPLGIEKLAVGCIVKQSLLNRYPEYMNRVREDAACKIAEKMMDDKLIEFKTVEEVSFNGHKQIVVRATALVCKPEVE